MINNNLMMASGAPWFSNPTLKINFENGWIDQVKGTAWIPSDSNLAYIDIRTYQPKFGSYCMVALNKGRYMYKNYESDFAIGGNDFTLAFWIKWQSVGSTFEQQTILAGMGNAFQLETGPSYSGLYIRVISQTPVTVYSAGPVPYASNNVWNYVKCGRKGNKIFINMNNNQMTATVPDNLILQNIASAFTFGNHYGTEYEYQTYFDSFIFVNGVGDDSLDIPTTPF